MNLKQVAAVAGVSVSTVSRVLNGKSYVNEETRRIVTEAIRKTNYQPNALAQSLKMGAAIRLPDDSLHREPDVPQADPRVRMRHAKRNDRFLCNTDEDAAIEKRLSGNHEAALDRRVYRLLAGQRRPAHPQPAR